MSHVLLLDSNVWSHLILGDAAKREKMKAQLAALRVKYPGAVKATSGICVAECLVAVRRLADKASAVQFEALFQTEFSSLDLIVVEVNAERVGYRSNSARHEAVSSRAKGKSKRWVGWRQATAARRNHCRQLPGLHTTGNSGD